MDIIAHVKQTVRSGTEIPKPAAKTPFLVKDWGMRRGQPALIYTIPNRSGGRPYEKGVTESELLEAYNQLRASGCFSRTWFNANMAECAKEGGCNFTTIGGLFELIDEARRCERGKYRTV